MQLCLFECKKILKQRMNWIMLIAFTLLSIYIFCETNNYSSSVSEEYYKADGTKMSEQEVKDEIASAKQMWTGTMDETWWNQLQAEDIKARYTHIYRLIDFDKMNAHYGETWYDDYRAHPEQYRFPNEEEKVAENIHTLYPREKLYLEQADIYMKVVRELYLNYGITMMENKPWNSNDGTFNTAYSMTDGKAHKMFVYSNTNLTSTELLLLKDKMNAKASFHYGDSKGCFAILKTLSSVGIFLAIWVIIIASNAINKERSNGMLEVLSSTTQGGGKLFVCKAISTFVCGIFGLCFMIGGLLLFASITGVIGDYNVNVTEGLHTISIFTYGEAFFISMGVMIIGVLATSLIGVVVSTWLSSSYLSLALSFLIIFLPQFIKGIEVLFPIEFMRVNEVAVTRFTINILDKAYFVYTMLPLLWLPICSILLWMGWRKFTSKTYQRI